MKETQVSGGWDKERRKLVIKTVVLTVVIMIFFELILAIITLPYWFNSSFWYKRFWAAQIHYKGHLVSDWRVYIGRSDLVITGMDRRGFRHIYVLDPSRPKLWCANPNNFLIFSRWVYSKEYPNHGKPYGLPITDSDTNLSVKLDDNKVCIGFFVEKDPKEYLQITYDKESYSQHKGHY